jgi:hypothetical protein
MISALLGMANDGVSEICGQEYSGRIECILTSMTAVTDGRVEPQQ